MEGTIANFFLGVSHGHCILAVVGKVSFQGTDAEESDLLDTAQEHRIPTPTIKELYGWISAPETSPIDLQDVDIVLSYLFWKKIKRPLLGLPKVAANNFHPAPLPELRGMGGYNVAIMQKRTRYGVTAHYMNEEIDRGDIIQVRNFEMDPEQETALTLERKSQHEMFELFRDVIDRKIRAFWFPPYDGAFIQMAGKEYTLVHDKILKQWMSGS
jgi:methionyl-tRNA formyltransferase